jgi:prepilin-type processing-associated H-X9-DG protein
MENIREPSRIVIFADATQTSNGWANTSLTLLPGGRQNPGLPSPRNAEDPLNIPEIKDGERSDGTSISFRHGDDERANVAFVDGHVQTVRRGELMNYNLIIWD